MIVNVRAIVLRRAMIVAVVVQVGVAVGSEMMAYMDHSVVVNPC